MDQQHLHSIGTLLHGYAHLPPAQQRLAISGLALDSRQVQPGDLFCAVRGGQRHGLEFLATAKERGAAAVAWEPPWDGVLPAPAPIPLVAVPHLRNRLGSIANRFYAAPSQQLDVVGITGTDGKTSCAHFIAQALSTPSQPCGILGTLGIGEYRNTQPATHTTPDVCSVQRWLAQLVAATRQYAVMEVSSHALDQQRVQGVQFAVAVLTQLSRDHLDYHHTVEAYAAAKRHLFTTYAPHWAVLNLDDNFGQQLVRDQQAQHGVIAYALNAAPTKLTHWLHGTKLRLSTAGLQLHVQSSWGEGELSAPLLGRFNASNLLASLATLLALGLPWTEALTRLRQSATVPGRMERIGDAVRHPLAVVDYAHTPHALQQVLCALREHGQRVWCVFGCGGERDAGKRPLMGAVAEQYAQQVIITDDNPRTESPTHITNAILSGMREPAAASVIHDRRSAICHALSQAQRGDIVLIAGKGAEDYQIVGTERRPCSDRATVQDFFHGPCT